MNPEESDENELRFCFYKDGEFVNRPLTVASLGGHRRGDRRHRLDDGESRTAILGDEAE